jgi:LAO/AO transport system kinase
MTEELSLDQYCDGVLAGERRVLAKAITLLESRLPQHRALGQQVLDRLVPSTGNAIRVGITGPPGVGKSSFVETLGLKLLPAGQRVAVLTVDPSSPVSGGSILGDKTRMELLSREEGAYIRPSPSGGTLGGVAHRTREAILLCEAAGYDIVFVETVGVGQSEVEVRSMVDCFCVLLQPGAGDELQGMKKGVLELADVLVVNKCDGDNRAAAERTRSEHEQALQLLRPTSDQWLPRVITASALEDLGLEDFWKIVLEHRDSLVASGELVRARREQARAWLWRLLREGLEGDFRADPRIRTRLRELEDQVADRRASAPQAARELLDAFKDEGRRRS